MSFQRQNQDPLGTGYWNYPIKRCSSWTVTLFGEARGRKCHINKENAGFEFHISKRYRKEWPFLHLTPSSEEQGPAIIWTLTGSEQSFVRSIIMSGAQFDWCANLHSPCSEHFLFIFSFCPCLPIANGLGELMTQEINKQVLFLNIKSLWSCQRFFFFFYTMDFPLSLRTKMMLAGNIYLLVCLIQVMR